MRGKRAKDLRREAMHQWLITGSKVPFKRFFREAKRVYHALGGVHAEVRRVSE